MIDKICLFLSRDVCPITRTRGPLIFTEKEFSKPEKHWEDSEGFYVQYMREKRTKIIWSTNVDIDYMREKFKAKMPAMSILFDYGTEMMECLSNYDKLITLSKYTFSQMPKDVFLWIYEMATCDEDILSQFIHFYLNEVHPGFGGKRGSQIFSTIQLDKLRKIVEDEEMCKKIYKIAGPNMCVYAAEYAQSLKESECNLFKNQITRMEIPQLPLEMNDKALERFVKTIRVILGNNERSKLTVICDRE